MKRGKRYQESLKLLEKGASYDAKEAFALIEKMPKAKFDETIEAHFIIVCSCLNKNTNKIEEYFQKSLYKTKNQAGDAYLKINYK